MHDDGFVDGLSLPSFIKANIWRLIPLALSLGLTLSKPKTAYLIQCFENFYRKVRLFRWLHLEVVVALHCCDSLDGWSFGYSELLTFNPTVARWLTPFEDFHAVCRKIGLFPWIDMEVDVTLDHPHWEWE